MTQGALTARTGKKSSQTILKRKNGRLVTHKGRNRVLGPRIAPLELPSPCALRDVAESNADPSSCPTTPSIVGFVGDDTQLLSDFDITSSTADLFEAGQSILDDCSSSSPLKVQPTKRIRVRKFSQIYYQIY
jgi:hypothetical protein